MFQLNQSRIKYISALPEFGCEAHAQDIRHIVLDLIILRSFGRQHIWYVLQAMKKSKLIGGPV
jgi:hypothetical protein